METYSIFFELDEEQTRIHKDSVINIAKDNGATLIDVVLSVVNGINYTFKISFSDEKTLDKFIREVDEDWENNQPSDLEEVIL